MSDFAEMYKRFNLDEHQLDHLIDILPDLKGGEDVNSLICFAQIIEKIFK